MVKESVSLRNITQKIQKNKNKTKQNKKQNKKTTKQKGVRTKQGNRTKHRRHSFVHIIFKQIKTNKVHK